jgi:hypothetical protein
MKLDNKKYTVSYELEACKRLIHKREPEVCNLRKVASVASVPINFFCNNLNSAFPSIHRLSEQSVNFNSDPLINSTV